MKEFCFSGTLGDAFIVFCKLHHYCKSTNEEVIIRRYSRHSNFDNIIDILFSLDPKIHYQKPCVKSLHPFSNIKDDHAEYINISWDGRGIGDSLPDPDYLIFDPFPDLDISRVYPEAAHSNSKKHIHNGGKFKIGIQLHSGKKQTNFKGLSLNWIRQIRKSLPEEYDIFIFGTGEGYPSSQINKLTSDTSVISLVGKTTFNEWLYHLTCLDFLISPEGFSAFFSMSQRIPTLAFYSLTESLCRVHPQWRRHNILIDIDRGGFVPKFKKLIASKFNRFFYYDPLMPEFVRPIIEQNTISSS